MLFITHTLLFFSVCIIFCLPIILTEIGVVHSVTDIKRKFLCEVVPAVVMINSIAYIVRIIFFWTMSLILNIFNLGLTIL